MAARSMGSSPRGEVWRPPGLAILVDPPLLALFHIAWPRASEVDETTMRGRRAGVGEPQNGRLANRNKISTRI
jgi:hypothetical protein